jgi:hypothetical protein
MITGEKTGEDTIEINLPIGCEKSVKINGRLVWSKGEFVVPWTAEEVEREVYKMNDNARCCGFSEGAEWAEERIKERG